MKGVLVCRCCLSETCFKDISNEYIHDGQREVYSEMLLSTFNINISYQESSSRLICEDCILRLRDAASFHAQVLRVEEIIVKNLDRTVYHEETKLLKFMDIKDDFLDHVKGEFENEPESGDDTWPEDNMARDDSVIILKMEAVDSISKQPGNLEAIKRTMEYVANKEKILKLQKNIKKRVRKVKAKPIKDKKKSKKVKNLYQPKAKENTLKLINNSNICLFESLKTKFRCFYCKNSYLNIKDLREHSTTHSNQNYLKMCINRLQGMSFKNVDISELSCKLCSETLTDLNELLNHLIQRHNIEFSTQEHLLIPYRIDKEFSCVHCNQKFNSFYRLSIHMNTHYTNNVCEICGVSYINRISLRTHKNRMHTEKKCAICSAVFTNAYTYRKHMRKIHNCAQSKRYCLLCNTYVRFIFGLRKYDRVSEFRTKLKWLPIRLRRNAHLMSLVYNILHNPQSPSYLRERLRYSRPEDKPCRPNVRFNLAIPPNLTHFYSRSFTVRAASLWNLLPHTVRDSPSISTRRERDRSSFMEITGQIHLVHELGPATSQSFVVQH